MATGKNLSIEDLEKLLDSKNKSLEELIEEYKMAQDNPFGETSKDRLNALSEETKRNSAELDDTISKETKKLNNVNKDIAENLFKNKENIANDLKSARNRLEELKKNQKITEEQYEKALNSIAEIEEKAINAQKSINKEQAALNKRIVEGTTCLDDFGESFELRTRALRKGFRDINHGLGQIYTSITNTLEPWLKANDAAMKYARSMGMSQKMADSYLKNTVNWASKNNIGLLFGKTTEELINMQNKYSDVLGRNVQLTSEQKKDMLAMEKFLGEDGMTDIANNLENFGLGMSDSAAFVKKTFDEATRYGISASKLTKTVRENIKMAQNYSFKDGLDGLTRMARKAIELKTDMSVINGFIDKVSTVEGAITTGANLQVLGGSYAMGSDPLSMLHESLNNVEGLFDRFAGMAKGKVFYNEKTGNFEMGAMDRYLMKQAATQMGIDPTKMFDVAFRQASIRKIENQARENSVLANDTELLDLVKNLATWDKGQAVVNIDGRDVSVSDIKEKDKEKLQAMQRNDSQNLQDMAISLRSTNEILSGIKAEISNEQASMVETVGQGITDVLRSNTDTLNTFAKIGAGLNIAKGILGVVGGIYTTTNGILAMMPGTRNLFRGAGKLWGKGRAAWRGMPGNIITSRERIQWRSLGNGTFVNVNDPSQTLSGTNARNMIRGGSKMKLGALGKTLKYGGIVGAGAVSLGMDALDGTLQKDTGASLGKAAAVTVGAAIGSVIPVVGPIIGGVIAGAITDAVQDSQKKNRAEIRKQIASKLDGSMSHLSGLFVGDNALQGNYSESQLNKIKEILQDNKIEESELSGFSGAWLKRLLRNNNDLVRMRDSGVDVQIAMASGGRLKGKSHAEGGMPILGSNVVVEGGEYVVNKDSTERFLPLLEFINSQKATAQTTKTVDVTPHIENEPLIKVSPVINTSIEDKGDKQTKEKEKTPSFIKYNPLSALRPVATNTVTEKENNTIEYINKPDNVSRTKDTPVSNTTPVINFTYENGSQNISHGTLFNTVDIAKHNTPTEEIVINKKETSPYVVDVSPIYPLVPSSTPNEHETRYNTPTKETIIYKNEVSPQVIDVTKHEIPSNRNIIHKNEPSPQVIDITKHETSVNKSTIHKDESSPQIVSVVKYKTPVNETTISENETSPHTTDISSTKPFVLLNNSNNDKTKYKVPTNETIINKNEVYPRVIDATSIEPPMLSNISNEHKDYAITQEPPKTAFSSPQITPMDNITISPIEPLGRQMRVSTDGIGRSSNMSLDSSVSIEPVSINLSGTIKLDTGNKQVDVTNDILSNPVLINKLTEMINKQLSIVNYGAYNKGRFKQKFV